MTRARIDSPHTIYWNSLISILGMLSYVIEIFLKKNSLTICKQWRPRSDAHSAASDLGLHYLPVTLFGVSRLKWVKCVNGFHSWFPSSSNYLLFLPVNMP